jgi:hypothetical protein
MERQYGSFSLPTEVLVSRLIRVKPLFKHPLRAHQPMLKNVLTKHRWVRPNNTVYPFLSFLGSSRYKTRLEGSGDRW